MFVNQPRTRCCAVEVGL